jgi:hypothetical protein
MTNTNESDFRCERLAGDVRYVLPPRRLGRARLAGWILIGFGLFATAFMSIWMGGPLLSGLELLQQQNAFGWLLVGFGLLGVFGLVPALGMLIGGLALVTNSIRCTVEVKNGRLYSSERILGFIPWRRKRSVAQINRLRVISALSSQSRRDKAQLAAQGLEHSGYAIRAEGPDIKEMVVAPGFPHELTVRLASQLAEHIEAEAIISAGAARKVTVAETSIEPARGMDEQHPIASHEETPHQPTNSDATIERRDDGITIHVPPSGLWKGSKGLFAFAILWNGFISIFVVLVILSLIGVLPRDVDSSPWAALFLVPFLAVGVGLLLVAINMGRRFAIIATAGSRVMIVRQTIFGSQRREWSADQIDEIVCGPSGLEVNEQPVYELQVHPMRGKKYGLLSQRERGELNWMAAELRRALDLVRQTDVMSSLPQIQEDAVGRLVPPDGSPITYEQSPSATQIRVPARGFSRCASTMALGAILFAVGSGVWTGFAFNELDKQRWFTIAFLALWSLTFAGAGLTLFFVAMIAARRRFDIRVSASELRVDRRGPMGRRTFRWDADQVKSVRVVDSNTKINGRSLYQVRIIPTRGRPLSIMTGHSKVDLAFVAAAIKPWLEECEPIVCAVRV